MLAPADRALTFSQTSPGFLRVCCTSLLETLWEKEKLLEQFLLFHSVFYPSKELSAIFIKFKNCRLQTFSVWTSKKFVIWERVKEQKENQHFLHFLHCFYQKLHYEFQHMSYLMLNNPPPPLPHNPGF